MRTLRQNVVRNNSKNELKRDLKNKLKAVIIFSVLLFSSILTFAHCDTMEGPLITDAKKAISMNNVNIVLKWVPAASEAEIKNAFSQIMKVRVLNDDAKDIADKYFFDTLVRIHRTGEGVAFTGVKPVGVPIDEKVKAADKSIEVGSLTPLKGLVAKDDMPELKERFEKVMSLKNFDVNNVDAGRKFIEAYVEFFKFAEGEAAHASEGCGHSAPSHHQTH